MRGMAESAKNPKMLAEALEMMKDPEVAAEVHRLMKDPEFQAEMKKFTESPSFKAAKENAQNVMENLEADPVKLKNIAAQVQEMMNEP